ncbi:DinB family protein [Paenibacillus sp. TRM 82003]|nr:DinB family protein [Paenibacillus sp. TRM 82003]
MAHHLFTQLEFVREQTLKVAHGLTEAEVDRVPEGFRNTIRWNLGHIYVVLERFAFQYIGLPLERPDGWKELFEYGSSPLTPPEGVAMPTLEELEAALRGQPGRIREALANRLPEPVDPPYTTSTGITLSTPEQFLSLALYHEGMHMSVIKTYKRLLS